MDPTTAVENNGTITNTQIRTLIQIKKIGDWKPENLLSDTQFKLFSDAACTQQLLTDSTGVPIGTDGIITTDADGVANIGSLIAGTYYLQEVAAAPGYHLLSGVVAFTVNTDGTIEYSTGNTNYDSKYGAVYEIVEGEPDSGYGIVINNSSGVELPHTGGIGTNILYFFGTVLTALSSTALIFGREARLLPARRGRTGKEGERA
jgi:LPXTG-motif cell wall-anchored protein